jgi:hypothetical protein
VRERRGAGVRLEAVRARQRGRGQGGRGDHAVAPLPLGLQESRVRAPEELWVGRMLPFRRRGAGGDGEVEVGGPPLGDRVPDPFGDLHGLGQRETGEKQQKFLTADAVDELEGAHRFADLVRDVTQHGIATLVAVVVVDPLERIEVQQHD